MVIHNDNNFGFCTIWVKSVKVMFMQKDDKVTAVKVIIFERRILQCGFESAWNGYTSYKVCS